MIMALNLLAKIGIGSVAELARYISKTAGSVLDRIGFIKQLSEAEKIDKYLALFKISEDSTDSARKMFIQEMTSQKQSWLIKTMNGLVRPIGGLGALFTEFYVIWGENIAQWFDVEFAPISLSTEQHLFLGAICGFYFGSRLKETLGGVSTKR